MTYNLLGDKGRDESTLCFLCKIFAYLCLGTCHGCLGEPFTKMKKRKQARSVRAKQLAASIAFDEVFNASKHAYETRHSAAPLPLNEKRARKLSISSSEHLVENSPKASDQTQPALFRLPYEVRQMIWNEILGTSVVHIDCAGKRLRHTMCQRCTPSSFQYAVRPGYKCTPGSELFGADDPRDPCACNIFSIIRVCRKMYADWIPLVYSRSVFSFNDPLQITWFASTILPHRLAQITTVRLRWRFVDPEALYPHGPHSRFEFIPPYSAKDWENACRALAGMTGLNDLRIFLDSEMMPSRNLTTQKMNDWSRAVYTPLAEITSPRTFDVYYSFPLRATGIPSNTPFRLIRSLELKTDAAPSQRGEFVAAGGSGEY